MLDYVVALSVSIASAAPSVTRTGAITAVEGFRAQLPRGFEKSKTHGTLSNGVTAVTTLCLADDFTFTRRLLIRSASTSYVGGSSSASAAVESRSTGYRDGETSGTWSFDGTTLALEFEDGAEQELSLEFAEAGFVSGGGYWERVAQ